MVSMEQRPLFARSSDYMGMIDHRTCTYESARLHPPARSHSGRGKALVQLRIDGMFSIGAPKQAAEPARATGAMDVDSVNAETGPPCYVCTGELEAEGGDILCSFCDRAACDKCWQNCFACKVPHCSLCLTADFSSQFECYFCPTCYQDKRREECGGDSDSMD